MSLILPSYQSGFAPRDYEPAYPSLWQGCVAAYAPLLGPTGLVLRDAVGKNDGVLTNGPTWDISGGRYALGFDGSNDYVNCGNPSYLSGASFLSISIWLFPRTINQFAGIATKDPATGGVNRFGIFTGFSGTEVLFACGAGNDYGRSGSLINNAWNHIAFVFDGTKSGNANRLRGYINGQQLTLNFTGTISSTTPTNSANFGMMTPMDGGTYANARGDDLRVYTRTLTDQEVLLLASRRGIAYEPRRVRVRYFRGFSPKKKLLEAKITSTVPGSYQTGYAPRDGEPVYPELWKGCVGAWSAGLGPSNLLRDNAGKNHGTLVNGPTYQVSGGQYALNFDGSNDGVTVSSSSAIRPANGLTISLWLRATNLSGLRYLIDNQSGSPYYGYGVAILTSKFYFNAAYDVNANDHASTATISTNRWIHAAFTYDKVSSKIFINGVLDSTKSASGTITYPFTQDLFIGNQNNFSDWFAGDLDDIRLYDRALSPNEIKLLASQRNIAYAHRKKNIAFRAYDPITQVGVGKITSIIPGGYHTGVGGLNNEPAYPELTKGLVGGWCPSLGVTGGMLRDNSGQGNHGVLTGMDPGTDWVVSGGKYALDFDGSNDYVEYGASSLLGGSGSITLSAHVRAASLNLPANTVISKMQIANDQPAYLLAFLSNGKFYCATTTGSPAGAQEYQSTSAVLPTLTWSHVSVSYTWGTGASLQLYLDGVPVSGSWTTGNGNVTFTGTTTLTQKIGRLQHTGVNTFFSWNGTLDDVRIYNRVLSPNEIRLLASRRGIGYDYKMHRSYSKTQSSGLLKRLILTGQT